MGGPLVEIVLVLLFVFLTLSAVISLINELISQVFQLKAGNLRRCIRELLHDKRYEDRISKRFFQHPMITSLGGRTRKSTYLSAEVFTVALSTAIQPSWVAGDPVIALPAAIEALDDGELKTRLRLALPEAQIGASREAIVASVHAWFATAEQRMSDRFKADSRARLYITAAFVVVLFNVSPIEIVKRLTEKDSLRSEFAYAVPQLTSFLFSDGPLARTLVEPQDGQPVEPDPILTPAPAPAATPAPGVTPTPATPVQAAARAAAGPDGALSQGEVQRMLALYHCSENALSLPVGWPWMADVTDSLRTRSNNLFSGGAQTCQKALTAAGASQDLANRVDSLSSAPAAAQGIATDPRAIERKFGPSFDTDPPYVILLGWLIAILAGAQGAPFWFNLLQRLIARR
jgi:hypothetical protein